jgi:hypothetical protein
LAVVEAVKVIQTIALTVRDKAAAQAEAAAGGLDPVALVLPDKVMQVALVTGRKVVLVQVAAAVALAALVLVTLTPATAV